MFDTSLFQDGIRKNPGNNGHGNGKALAGDRTFPYFMAAFSLPNEHAPVFEQDASQLWIKGVAHELQGNSVFGCLVLLKTDAHGIHAYINCIFCCNFRGDFPHAFSQTFVCFGFGSQSKFIAYGNPHAGFTVVAYFYNEERSIHRSKAYNKFKLLTNAATQAYPFSATERNVVGFGSPDVSGDEPQPLCDAAFLLPGVPFMGGLGGEPQGSPALTRSSNPPIIRPPCLEAWQAVRLTNWSQRIMTTTDLVPVFTGTIQHQSVQLCNARDLHAALKIETRFNDWISRRISEYEFTEGEDFYSILSKTRGRPVTDYHLTLDMAKELAMVENNEKGRQIRRYFISLERRSSKPTLPNASTQAEELKALKEQLLKSLPNLAINPPVWTRPGRSGTSAPQNIEVARKLINELKVWANSLPHEIGHPLWDALDDLNNLLLHGWTEVDEALLHFSVGTGYLKRWMGREKQGGKK